MIGKKYIADQELLADDPDWNHEMYVVEVTAIKGGEVYFDCLIDLPTHNLEGRENLSLSEMRFKNVYKPFQQVMENV